MKHLTDFHKTVETGVDPRLFIVARGNPQPLPLNPLSPKSDQHQISPCNINAL